MKIGLAHNLYGERAKGGAEKLVQKMIEDFLNDGHEVFLISLKDKSENFEIKTGEDPLFKKYLIPSSYSNLGEQKIYKKLFWHLSNFCNPKRKNLLQNIVDSEMPDLFISHNLIGIGFFLSKILQKRGIRHEHFLHDIQLLHPSGLMFAGKEKLINSLPAKTYQAITKHFFKSTAKVISPSKWLMEEHLKRQFFTMTDKEIRRLRELKKSEKIINNKKDGAFLFVGQIEKHKGILFLIKAFKKIENKNISLRVAGDGRDFILAQKETGDDKRIIFLGRLNELAIQEEMKKARALIVPSLCYENSPTVIYEAGEFALPVIASKIGGIPEILSEKDISFEAENESDLIKAITSFS